jgi:hypothetical protein
LKSNKLLSPNLKKVSNEYVDALIRRNKDQADKIIFNQIEKIMLAPCPQIV